MLLLRAVATAALGPKEDPPMRLMTITVCALLYALSASCSVTPLEAELADLDDGMDMEAVSATPAPAPVPAGTCSCNPAPDSTNGWVLAKNADGTLKQNCGRCTNSSLCSTGFCTYVNSVGSERDVGCQWASTLPDPTDPVPTEPVPVEPHN
jgi:hypothetical protein